MMSQIILLSTKTGEEMISMILTRMPMAIITTKEGIEEMMGANTLHEYMADCQGHLGHQMVETMAMMRTKVMEVLTIHKTLMTITIF